MSAGERQLFGERPVEVRETDHYRYEYIKSFVEKWDELIDWELRAESEGISLSGCSWSVGCIRFSTPPRARGSTRCGC